VWISFTAKDKDARPVASCLTSRTGASKCRSSLPICLLAKFASDGTLKMLAYLVLLHDPAPPPFIGMEEPENFLHPRLLPELAEECRAACERTQILVTTAFAFLPQCPAAGGGTRVVA